MIKTMIAALMAFCLTVSSSAPAFALDLPKPEGPYAVGYTSMPLRLVRLDDLAESPDAHRKIFLEVFYPAQQPKTTAKPYATEFIADSLAQDFSLPKDFSYHVTTNSFLNAPAAAGRFPVIVFSHGLSWPVTLYQSLLEDLASRGYVVIAINHPHGAALDYGGGATLGRERWPNPDNEESREAMLAQRAADWSADISDVLSKLRSWKRASAENPAAGHLDLDRIGLSGHSYGGTAVGRMTSDPRIRAVAIMEGKVRNENNTPETVMRPLLHLIGGYNRLELEGADYRPSNGAPVYQAIVNGTGHAYFSDLIYIYRNFADADWIRRHRYETASERVIQITRDYLAAFFGRYLKDEDLSVLLQPKSYAASVDGPSKGGYPEIDLTISVE